MGRFSNRFSLVSFVVKDHPKWIVYSFAIFLSILAAWLSETFWSYSGEGKTHTMLPLAAVFICGVIGGSGPGLLAAIISTGALTYLLDPSHALYIKNPTDRIWLSIYFILSMGAVWLASVLKSAIQNSKKLSEKLERKVEARTAELTNANKELKRALAEIEESRSFLDSLIENIPLPIYLKSAHDLKITRVNRAARDMYEKTVNVIGKTVYDVLPSESAQKLTAGDLEALRRGSVFWSEETLRDSKGRVKVLSINRLPLFNQSGEPAYVLGIAEDITEKKRAAEQRIKLEIEQAAREEAEQKKRELEDAVRARDTFLSICSHELKTPLTSLKLQAGVIRMLFEKADFEALRSPKVRDLVMDADKEINRINRLINDMLDVSRIRSGKLTLHPGQVDLSEVVREVVGHFRSIPMFKDIKIMTQIPDHAIGVWDRNRIEQIAINLVSNALKYGNGKPVQVTVDTDEKDAYLIIEDQGVGIDASDQKRIFQRFERASASESISGLGLGLYIVREIVSMHGGDICVESEPGKGSRFTVKLPIRADTSAKAA